VTTMQPHVAPPAVRQAAGPIVLSLADDADRQAIYAIRHRVYSDELHQHPANRDGLLRDALDDVNTYVVAKREGAVIGFVAITPPSARGYSIDKYFVRDDLPITFDDRLYEIRILTVVPEARASLVAPLLMYGAFRYVDWCGATTIVGIGRREILQLYTHIGMRPLGWTARSGAVEYELMMVDIAEARASAEALEPLIGRLERQIDWQMTGITFRRERACYHGGAFWDELGPELDDLDRSGSIINADVLDAWFDPAPEVTAAVASHLPFALKTSPPTNCEGMRRVIARARGVPESAILPGAGSSDLIFLAFRRWLTARSRVLILDPMYGEYAHVLEQVMELPADRLPLSRADDYALNLDVAREQVARGYDWVVLVNPNSPTGRHVPRGRLRALIEGAPPTTRFWIDETYVDFVGPGRSLEQDAARSTNVIVCKSMSKAYALSGVRAAYLCGAPRLIDELRPHSPPWAVSLPGQIAACKAIEATEYYAARWRETSMLREALGGQLAALGWDVIPGTANFLLCHPPEAGPTAAAVVAAARERGLFVRDVRGMGRSLGTHALRIAVKDARTNQRMVEILREI
jgi:histidinol-phosphate/aromatic aminotransferase/cobyric acid decarboxylase-like protein